MGKSPASKMPTLDLHGRRPEEVFDLIEAFLAKHAHAPRVRIMPGKGTGVVKAQVVDYLKKAHYPWEFEKTGPGANEGVMIVFVT